MSTQGDTHRRSRRLRWRRTSSSVATGAVVAGLLVLSPGQADAAGATTYTVDNSAAAGCSDTPTSGQPYCTITAAVKAAAAGATITVGPGTYNERVDVTKSGLTLQAPNGATVDATGAASPLYGFDIMATKVTVDGFTVTNQTGAGVFVNGSSTNGPVDGSTVRNVTAVGPGSASGNTANGIKVTSANNVTVTNVTVHGYARAGVLFQGATNSTVKSSETYQNQREGVSIQGGSGDVVQNVTSHDNVNLDSGGRLAPGINVTDWSSGIAPNVVDQLASGIIVERNISYNNDDSGIQVYGGSQNITVRRNLVYGNGDHGIDFSMASSGSVVGNTALHNFTAGINIESNAAGVGALATVGDNVAMNNGNGDGSSTPLRTRGDIRVDGPSVAAGSQIDYDLVYDSTGQTVLTWGTTTYPSLDAFHKDVPGQEVHGLNTDPKLDGNNVPGAGSPAIDAANAGVAGFAASDLKGNAPVDDTTVKDSGAGTPTFADLGALERTSVPANQAPTATLTATPSTLTAGGTVTLDATGSTDPENGKLTYAFDCGATGVTATATGGKATCTYPSAGSYTAKVTVTDDQGASSTATAAITVNAAGGGGGGGGGGPVNAAPTAQLTASPATVVEGGSVTLDASGSKDSDGSIAGYAFDCGDGSAATVGQNASTATCTYAKAGSYTGTVTVTDNQGATDKATATVTVTKATAQAPTATLTGGRVRRGQPIRIDASGSHASGDATLVSYLFRCAGRWIGPKPGPRAVCVFRKVGVHRVRVKVTDSNGLTDWASAQVRVLPSRRPVARLSLSDHVISTGGSVLAFAGRSHGFPGAYVKDVRFRCGNGEHSDWRKSRTYRCSYDQPGTYTVTVVVRNTYGQRDRASRVVRVG